MRADLLAAAFAGALGGVLGGFVSSWARPHDRPAVVVTAERGDDLRELSAQVTALEGQVDQLRRAAQVSPRAPRDAKAPPGDAPRGHALVDDPVFETAVRDVMDRMQQERAGEREERRAQAVQRWADRLAAQAELSDPQKAKALSLAQELADKLRDLRDSDAGPDTPQAWAAQRDALRTQSEQRLAEVLSPHQMEIYRGSSELLLDTGWARGGRGRGGP